MRHKIEAHKVCQITIVSYLPVIQIKLYIGYWDSEMTVKIQQFQLSKNK